MARSVFKKESLHGTVDSVCIRSVYGEQNHSQEGSQLNKGLRRDLNVAKWN
jgi:hypothetical protein